MTTLVLGLSTRAIAESAVRGDYSIFTLDYFGDQDQKSLVKNFSLLRNYGLPFSAENLLKASADLKFDSVVYTSNLENHPDLVRRLAARAHVLGNGPDVLCRIRDWAELRKFFRQESIPHPLTLLPGEEHTATEKIDWLLKPVHSGGGSGVRSWGGSRLKSPWVLQARVDGIPASAVFVANGNQSVMFGLTEQLIGCRELGVSGYSWCGNILPLPIENAKRIVVLEKVTKMVGLITKHFELRGVGGVDFIIAPGSDGELCPFPVEINPRYTASMELMERAYGLNIYAMHCRAMDGCLPEFSLSEHLDGPYFAKGVVFARKSLSIRDTRKWRARGRRDIPFAGDRIKPGSPVCSVFSEGNTYPECWSSLVLAAASVREDTFDIVEDNVEQSIYADYGTHPGPGQRLA